MEGSHHHQLPRVDTNLVHFLPPYYVIISDVYIWSFKCMISLVHGHAPKMVLHA